jgi:hypothetical protein
VGEGDGAKEMEGMVVALKVESSVLLLSTFSLIVTFTLMFPSEATALVVVVEFVLVFTAAAVAAVVTVFSTADVSPVDSSTFVAFVVLELILLNIWRNWGLNLGCPLNKDAPFKVLSHFALGMTPNTANLQSDFSKFKPRMAAT